MNTASYNVIVTEKPSVARTFADVLGVHSDEKTDGYIKGNGWIITWCRGHLVNLIKPEEYDEKYKSWALSNLPFLPTEYKYAVINDAGVKKQFKTVKEILNRKDVGIIYNAGDSGREGEYIQRLVYIQAGVEGKREIRRIWIDSQTREEILRGIREAKPESEYDNIYYAAKERSVADYAIGMNLTRAMTTQFAGAVNKPDGKKFRHIAVGRVMTCVLGMIVDREKEINEFVETPYYGISADHSAFLSGWKAVSGSKYFESPALYNETGLKNREDAQSLVDEMNANPFLQVVKSDKKPEKKSAPLLFNLAELQSECTKRYKISPSQTLEIVQRLYEHGLTTYPRTDARVLSTAVAKEVDTNIKGLQRVLPDMEECISGILNTGLWKTIADTRYVNDEKITDHYAIIPTGQGNLEDEQELDQKVYRLIAKRFLAIFCSPAVYEKYDIEFTHTNGEHFFVGKRLLKESGYLEVYGKADEDVTDDDSPDDETNMLQYIQVGNSIPAEFIVEDRKTQPPKRYTSGSMILAMEHAGKFIEDEELRAQIKDCGIGTSATRAETLSKLERDGYITLDKKTQILKPTEIGTTIVALVGRCMKDILRPDFTASWEKGLAQIEAGACPPEEYREKINSYVKRKVEAISKAEPVRLASRPHVERTVAGKCPVCGADLMFTKEYGYMCSKRRKNDKKTCQFAVWNTYNAPGHNYEEEIVKPLLNGQPTEYMEFKSKAGQTLKARLAIGEDGSVNYEYKMDASDKICPKCGNPLMQNEKYYNCSCGFGIQKILSSHAFTQEEINTLYKDGKIENMTGFKKKDGTDFKGPATIIYKDNHCSFDFGTKNKKKK